MNQPSLYTLPKAPHLMIACVEAGPVATNGYLLADTIKKTGIIIDAPYESLSVFNAIAEHLQISLAELWLTHSHWDHTADAEHCAARNMNILIHPADEYRLQDPMNHTVWPLPFTMAPVQPTRYIQEGDIVSVGDWQLTVIHTPGHTEGGVCFICHEHDCAFVGDTLFQGSIGRTDLPGGNAEELLQSIQSKLLVLPYEMVIFPGHGAISTIGEERENNPFLIG